MKLRYDRDMNRGKKLKAMSTDVLRSRVAVTIAVLGVASVTAMLVTNLDSACPLEEMRYWQLEQPIKEIRTIPVYLVENGFVGTKMPKLDVSSNSAMATTLSRPEVLNGMLFFNATIKPKGFMMIVDAKKNDRGGYPSCNRKLFRLYESSAEKTNDFIDDAMANKEINLTKLTNAIETNEKAWKELQRLDEKHYQGMLVGGYQD